MEFVSASVWCINGRCKYVFTHVWSCGVCCVQLCTNNHGPNSQKLQSQLGALAKLEKSQSKQATQKMKKNVFGNLRREAPWLSVWLVILLGCRFARHQLILAVWHTRSQTQ
jgi:hypothetical protein